jgi:hypothetical protein
MRKRLPEVLAGLSVLLAVMLLFHQKYVHHFWFSWHDFWHHESIEAIFVALAAGLLLGKYLALWSRG